MTSIKNGKKGIILDNPNEPKISQRVRKEKFLGPNFVSTKSFVFLMEGDRTKMFNNIVFVLNTKEDPKSI